MDLATVLRMFVNVRMDGPVKDVMFRIVLEILTAAEGVRAA